MEGVPKNPNKIHDLLSIGSAPLPTSADKVYRGVQGEAAIKDLFEHGEVRNAYSAGAEGSNTKGREDVFWSRGAEGKFHPLSGDRHVIEVPLEVAAERAVRHDDVTAIWALAEDGSVQDRLTELREKLGMKSG